MTRAFKGSFDESAVVLERVFPFSDLVISSPFSGKEKRSGVCFEGDPRHLEIVFGHLGKLLSVQEGPYFGRWIGLTPPDDSAARVIIHYQSLREFDTIQLLCFSVRRQLAGICDLRLSQISTVIVRYEGAVVLQKPVPLPSNFVNGKIILPE